MLASAQQGFVTPKLEEPNHRFPLFSCGPNMNDDPRYYAASQHHLEENRPGLSGPVDFSQFSEVIFGWKDGMREGQMFCRSRRIAASGGDWWHLNILMMIYES